MYVSGNFMALLTRNECRRNKFKEYFEALQRNGWLWVFCKSIVLYIQFKIIFRQLKKPSNKYTANSAEIEFTQSH